MWNLNDSPNQRKDEEESEEGCNSYGDGDELYKGKRVGSMSNSSSSAILIEDASDEEDGSGRKKRSSSSSKIFGFSVAHKHLDSCSPEAEPPIITRQFFPVDDSSEIIGTGGYGRAGCVATASATTSFPRAHWVGVKFCQSEPVGGGVVTGKSTEAPQPLKKSRRGPRSRSSQYRGVTFYRRTGRWESHIWFVYI